MLDLSTASREELEALVVKLDKSLMETYRRASGSSGEILALRKENDHLETALSLACEELVKAYKKTGKTNSKWLKSENWAAKFLKED